MGRTWYGGLLFQSEDYAQVAAMVFQLARSEGASRHGSFGKRTTPHFTRQLGANSSK